MAGPDSAPIQGLEGGKNRPCVRHHLAHLLHKMELNFSADEKGVAAKRSDLVAKLEQRKEERLAAKATRRAGVESLEAAAGGTTNVARSSDEFWALFNAGTKRA